MCIYLFLVRCYVAPTENIGASFIVVDLVLFECWCPLTHITVMVSLIFYQHAGEIAQLTPVDMLSLAPSLALSLSLS